MFSGISLWILGKFVAMLMFSGIRPVDLFGGYSVRHMSVFTVYDGREYKENDERLGLDLVSATRLLLLALRRVFGAWCCRARLLRDLSSPFETQWIKRARRKNELDGAQMDSVKNITTCWYIEWKVIMVVLENSKTSLRIICDILRWILKNSKKNS